MLLEMIHVVSVIIMLVIVSSESVEVLMLSVMLACWQ